MKKFLIIISVILIALSSLLLVLDFTTDTDMDEMIYHIILIALNIITLFVVTFLIKKDF